MKTTERARNYALAAVSTIGAIVALESCSPGSQDAMNCEAAPSTADAAAVRRLFDAPPLITQAPYSYTAATEGYDAARAELADTFHVTLPDEEMQQQLDTVLASQAGFDDKFRVSREYLAQFGIRLSFALKSDVYLARIPTDAQLMNPRASAVLDEMTAGFASLPYEYIHDSGLKRIVLAAHVGKHIAAYAETEGPHDTFVVDVTKEQSYDISPHETYHLEDAAECGSKQAMRNDPLYTELNGADDASIYTNRYDNEDAKAITLKGDISNDFESMLRAENAAAACKEQQVMDHDLTKVVAYSDYALRNPVEDKAELGAVIAFPEDYAEVLDPRMPIIRRKFELLMTRLYQRMPNVVRYLAAVSSRPDGYHYPDAEC